MKHKLCVLLVALLLIPVALAEKSEIEVQQALSEETETPVIVILNEPETTDNLILYTLKIRPKKPENFEEMKELIDYNQNKVLKKLDEDEFTLKHKYATINGFAGEVTMEGLSKLENNPSVKRIHPDRKAQIALDVSAGIVNAPDVHSLQVSGVDITGAGETVCVIDTGINYSHPALGACSQSEFLSGSCPTVIGGHNYCVDDACTSSSNNPLDNHGHGTHVSGIIISSNDTYKGIAPDVKLIMIKALNSSGEGSFSNVAAGVDWCVNNATKYNISVISMSIGTVAVYDDPEKDCNNTWATVAAINNAVKHNISVFVASGNEGSNVGIGYPSCARNATSVGATTDSDQVASYSNTDELLDLLAPGSSIKSTKYGTFLDDSGTSMATPHASAAAALLLQYEKLESSSSLSPDQIKEALNSTGPLITDTGNGLSFPRIDILAALSSIDNTAPSITVNTPQNTTYGNNSLSLDITVSEPADWCGFSFNGAGNVTMSNATSKDFNYTLTSFSEGSQSIAFSCNDTAGNPSTTPLIYFTIDANPPATVTSLQEASVTDSSIYWTWTNPSDSDYHHTEVWLDGSFVANSTSPYYNATSLLASTSYTLSTRTVDDYGNINNSWVNDSANTAADSTSPVIVLESPANNSAFLPGVILNFSITDNTAISEAWYTLTGSNISLSSPYDIDTSSWTRGQIDLTIWANDTTSLLTQESYNFTVNNSLPVLTVSNQSVLQNHTLEYQVTATDHDNDPISYYDNTSLFDINLSTGLINWTATQAFGDYLVLITASDGLGSVSEAITFSIITEPDLSPLSVAYSELHKGINTLNLTINNSESGLATNVLVYAYANGTLAGNATHDIPGYSASSYSIDTSLDYGTYNITFVVDPLNNIPEVVETNNNL